MSADTTRALARQGMSDAAICRHLGWGVGTRLTGDEGCGADIIRITAVGERHILAVTESQVRPTPTAHHEDTWTLSARDWAEVQTTPQDARSGTASSLEGSGGGDARLGAENALLRGQVERARITATATRDAASRAILPVVRELIEDVMGDILAALDGGATASPRPDETGERL